jgi:hypothetical protein
MRYVMFTYVDPDDVAAWEAMKPDEQSVEVNLVRDWFRKHADHIQGGEELDWPQHVKALRRGRQGDGVVVTDGPYVETKEILGGFIILATETQEQALQIASEWPSLSRHANATVQLQGVYVREP